MALLHFVVFCPICNNLPLPAAVEPKGPFRHTGSERRADSFHVETEVLVFVVGFIFACAPLLSFRMLERAWWEIIRGVTGSGRVLFLVRAADRLRLRDLPSASAFRPLPAGLCEIVGGSAPKLQASTIRSV
jgi:hypothetical protein